MKNPLSRPSSQNQTTEDSHISSAEMADREWTEKSTTIEPDLLPERMPVPPPTIAPIIPREPPGLGFCSKIAAESFDSGAQM